MNIIRGKVTVKETGAGVPDLMIPIYDLDSKKLPEQIFRLDPEKPVADLWQLIPGDRLGSVVTAEDGTFELRYEDEDFNTGKPERRPDLLLFVVAPEETSVNPGPRLLHISAPRQNSGRIESYMIKLPLGILRKAEVSIPGEQLSPVYGGEYEKLFERLNQLDERRRTGFKLKDALSENNGAPAEITPQTSSPQIQVRRQPQSFITSRLAVRGLTGAMSIEQDEDSDGLVLKENPDAQPVPLEFKGVKYSQDLATVDLPKNESSLLVDPETKAFYLCVPRSAVVLTAPDRPSALYKWHMNQQLPAASKITDPGQQKSPTPG